jgi:hypothetical protein
MKLEPIFIAVFLFASGLYIGRACGYYMTPLPRSKPNLHHRAIHLRPVNPVFEPLIEEDLDPVVPNRPPKPGKYARGVYAD